MHTVSCECPCHSIVVCRRVCQNLVSTLQKDLVNNAVDVARSYTPVLEMCAGLVAELDAYNAMAHMALVAPCQYVRPTIVASGGNIELIGARHPVMEFQEGMSFIANDYKYAVAS